MSDVLIGEAEPKRPVLVNVDELGPSAVRQVVGVVGAGIVESIYRGVRDEKKRTGPARLFVHLLAEPVDFLGQVDQFPGRSLEFVRGFGFLHLFPVNGLELLSLSHLLQLSAQVVQFFQGVLHGSQGEGFLPQVHQELVEFLRGFFQPFLGEDTVHGRAEALHGHFLEVAGGAEGLIAGIAADDGEGSSAAFSQLFEPLPLLNFAAELVPADPQSGMFETAEIQGDLRHRCGLIEKGILIRDAQRRQIGMHRGQSFSRLLRAATSRSQPSPLVAGENQATS